MLASELLRVKILIAFMTVMMVQVAISTAILHWLGRDLPGASSPLWLLPVFLGCLLYEVACRHFLLKLPPDADIPALARYGNAAIEACLPGLMIVVAATFFDPYVALSGPPVLLYFILLILSVLRLDGRLCLFTAAIGAVQYIGLAAWFGGHNDPALPAGLPMLAPHFGRAAVLLASGVITAIVARRIRRRLRDSLRVLEEHHRVLGVFGQHVSPAVAEALVAHGAPQHGELRTVCIMFLDVRGFTRFAEQRTPTAVVEFLDALFDPMIAVVGRHRGIINKFLGDGFMAVFGAPLPADAPARDAVAAAREILDGIERQIAAGALPPTRIGIGLHVGEALTGTIGSAARKEYTIIGDVVNLAARIEQLNKLHGSQLLVSDSVAAAIGDPGLQIGEVPVPGRDAPVKLVRLA